MAGCAERRARARRGRVAATVLALSVATVAGGYARASAAGAVPPGAPSSAASLMMEVDAEPEKPFVQARIRYRIRILARVPLRQATLSEPAAAGAIIRRIGGDRRLEVERDGVRYRVLERDYALFAERPGVLHIAAPRLSAAVPAQAAPGPETGGIPTGERAGAVFERLRTVTRSGPTLALEVRPVPAGAETPWLPAEAVSISEQWQPDRDELRLGEPVQRIVTVEAAGAIAASIPDPRLDAADGFRIYSEPAQVVERVIGDDLAAAKTLRWTLVPTRAGRLEMPAIRLPWWSLGADAPRQARLPARVLTVVASAGAGAKAPSAAAGEASRRLLLDAIDRDSWRWPWVALALAVTWLVVRRLRRSGRHRGGPPAPAARSPGTDDPPGIHACAERFRRACERNDARLARRALLDWGRACWPATPPRGPMQVLDRLGGGADARLALLGLEQRLYGGADRAWSGRAAAATMLPLLREAGRGREHPMERPAEPGLPGLYPAEREP